MSKRSRFYIKLGFSVLLTVILATLTYTSLVVSSKVIGAQQPCEERLLSNNNVGNNAKRNDAINPATKQSEQWNSLNENHNDSGALNTLGVEFKRIIQSKDARIMELERQLLSQVKAKSTIETKGIYPIIDRADDGVRPLRVTVAHHPRSDMLGSFVLPSILLLAITYRYGWEMEILPYDGSFGQRRLNLQFLGDGSKQTSIREANFRQDYSPTDLNAQAYENLGFFPQQPFPAANRSEWTEVKPLPAPGTDSLHKACRKRPIIETNGHVSCRLIVPFAHDTGMFVKHIMQHGTLEDYFTQDFRELMRNRFMQVNAHRLKYFTANATESYNVAIHVRRGDVNKEKYPDRWIEQSVYARVARHICSTHPNANIHVFSSGKNDEGWNELEQVNDICVSVSFHLDNVHEFDVWAHFVAADALVTSRSTFSYVPALLREGNVYAPEWGHAPLAFWNSFNEQGKLKLIT